MKPLDVIHRVLGRGRRPRWRKEVSLQERPGSESCGDRGSAFLEDVFSQEIGLVVAVLHRGVEDDGDLALNQGPCFRR